MQGSSNCWSVPGAGIDWIWYNSRTQPQAYLLADSADILFLCPSGFVKTEAAAVANFANVAIQGNPNVRIFIQERYNVEPTADGLWRFCFFEGSCDPTETIDNLFRPDMIRTAYKASAVIGRPVYDVPVASAIEAVKQLATSGKLDDYHSRMDLHQADGHLNILGSYVMAAAVWIAAYHQAPPALPSVYTSWRIMNDTLRLSSHDAALINQAVNDMVRGRLFSGWYGSEPTSYAAYQDSMAAALTNFETFEKIDTVASGDFNNGSFTGQNGIVWTYHHGFGSTNSTLTINEETMILAEVYSNTPNDKSYLYATIPNGISELTFQYRGRYKPPTSDGYKYRLAVMAGTDTIAVLNKILGGDTVYARRLEDVNLPPGGTLKFVQLGNDAARIDNIRWKDYDGSTRSAQKTATHEVLRPRLMFRNGVLSVPSGNSRLDIATLGGRALSRQVLKGESSIRLPLKPGLYVATVSGTGRSESLRLMVW
jgi:hypothetical protein